MFTKNRKSSVSAILALVTVAGCAAVVATDRVVREVQFSGYYNDITGELSDGTPFTGKSWFRGNTARGDFCLQAAEMVCSGTYSANLARRINGEMVCSNGLTGEYTTERVPKGDFVVPLDASGALSDGRTATATFSAIKQGSGAATCFVPKG